MLQLAHPMSRRDPMRQIPSGGDIVITVSGIMFNGTPITFNGVNLVYNGE